MEDLFVPVTLFLSLAAVAITYLVLNARTRRMLIERGVEGGAYAQLLAVESRLRTLTALKWGLVALGVGVAFVLISLLGLHRGEAGGPAIAGLLLIGAAAGLLGYWRLDQKGRLTASAAPAQTA